MTGQGLEFDTLCPEVTDAFAENGVVCLRGLVNQAGVEHLREWIEIAIANPSPRYAGKPNRTYIVDTRLWARFDGFREFAFASNVAEAAATVMGSREVRMFNDSMFVKEPSAPEPTPWHQDLPYFRLAGDNNCSAWIALDPANKASGAMSYALGSHRWGKMFRPVDFSRPGQFLTDDLFDGAAPDVDAHPELYPTVTFDLKPGDVVFHHLLTLHKAGPNSSQGTRRRVHTIRFAGDDSTWINRPFATAEFDDELEDGAPLEGSDFPILFRQRERAA